MYYSNRKVNKLSTLIDRKVREEKDKKVKEAKRIVKTELRLLEGLEKEQQEINKKRKKLEEKINNKLRKLGYSYNEYYGGKERISAVVDDVEKVTLGKIDDLLTIGNGKKARELILKLCNKYDIET